jgi:ActR/RegA family two-component response regulator
MAKRLLSIIELGGYPNFQPLYERLGFDVATVRVMRKALSTAKTLQPDVVVAEFNYQSDFRDRTSSLESLLAVVQRLPDTKVIVFLEKEYAHQFERVASRFPIYRALTFPIDAHELETAIADLV